MENNHRQTSLHSDGHSEQASGETGSVAARVETNLNFIRKELKKSGYTTIELARAVNSNSNKLKRLETHLKGTIASFICLLYFYQQIGVNLNDLFSMDFRAEPPVLDIAGIRAQKKIVIGSVEQDRISEQLRANLSYLRKEVLRGSRVTTEKLVEATGVASEKILRIEKALQGKIVSLVALLHFYAAEGLHLSDLLTSDLREDNRALSEVKSQMHLMDRFRDD